MNKKQKRFKKNKKVLKLQIFKIKIQKFKYSLLLTLQALWIAISTKLENKLNN
jgi:hypothetical protein